MASKFYDDSCSIKKIELIAWLDNRSGQIVSEKDIAAINLKLGVFEDTIVTRTLKQDDFFIVNKNDQKRLHLGIEFPDPFLEKLTFIDLTIYSNSALKSKNSLPYFYGNSLIKLKLDRTYLDYRAFLNRDVVFKEIRNSNNNEKWYLVTTKTKKDIDKVTNIRMQVNDSIRLDFRNSILASFNKYKIIDKGYQMKDFIKRSNTMLEFKLKLKSKNFKIENILIELY